MNILINTLFVLNALVLVGVVLIQQPKTSGGLFSGTGQSLLGTSGKTFWTKTTIVLAGVFMLLCIFMVKFPSAPKEQSSVADIIEKQNQAAASAQSLAVSNALPASVKSGAPPTTSTSQKQDPGTSKK